jgi:hypothetical protein
MQEGRRLEHIEVRVRLVVAPGRCWSAGQCGGVACSCALLDRQLDAAILELRLGDDAAPKPRLLPGLFTGVDLKKLVELALIAPCPAKVVSFQLPGLRVDGDGVFPPRFGMD